MTADAKNNNQNKPKSKNRKPNKSKNKPQQDNKRRLLIDASMPEETRVAVSQSGRLEDFEVESLVRKQIKGNIYLAKVTRVEPSLQAAFVNYGGNRHGFLPFSEIHPDYYRIPVADRERLMAEQAELERVAAEEAARIAEEEDRKAAMEEEKQSSPNDEDDNVEEVDDEDVVLDAGAEAKDEDESDADSDEDDVETEQSDDADDTAEASEGGDDSDSDDDGDEDDQKKSNRDRGRGRRGRGRGRRYSSARNKSDRVSDDDDVTAVEPFWKRMRRAYKIQEVIKRGQIMLIQVGKEERGNKGAAVTTYITLPGRYCVLMPNTPQSGGVSRKISNFKDRKRMREILKDLNVSEGMSVILRTAGTTRTKAEIKRDMDYLMRLWNNARDLTMKSQAPALINEEGSLIKRAVRDIYNKDIDEVCVSGDDGYKTARDMMKMLMPSHAKKVHHYKEPAPLFIKHKIEQQIEQMHSPQVELKSGGYLVINPTEALVSIDVNSGRATKERNIEDTALQTNIEAAQEIARQLRLRDLGGLVVIDFIDMENRKYNAKVERAMRDALAGDRARIQIGRISSFGLMEMSRQRLHPSLTEAHFEPCPHCHGMGIVKTVDTMALAVLRAIEESGLEQKDANVKVSVASNVVEYLFNHHRRAISELEDRYNLSIQIISAVIEEERGFILDSKRKPKSEVEEQDKDSAEDMMEEVDATAETVETSTDEEQPKKSKSRRNRSKSKKTDAQQDVTDAKSDEETSTEEVSAETSSEQPSEDEKPKAKKRSRPARKKKVEIKDANANDAKSDDVEGERTTKPAPTNDNAGKDDADVSPSSDNNQAARESETVNEAPKEKKKGWWNKITS